MAEVIACAGVIILTARRIGLTFMNEWIYLTRKKIPYSQLGNVQIEDLPSNQDYFIEYPFKLLIICIFTLFFAAVSDVPLRQDSFCLFLFVLVSSYVINYMVYKKIVFPSLVVARNRIFRKVTTIEHEDKGFQRLLDQIDKSALIYGSFFCLYGVLAQFKLELRPFVSWAFLLIFCWSKYSSIRKRVFNAASIFLGAFAMQGIRGSLFWAVISVFMELVCNTSLINYRSSGYITQFAGRGDNARQKGKVAPVDHKHDS